MQWRLLDAWSRWVFSELGWSASRALAALPPVPAKPTFLERLHLGWHMDLRWILGELAHPSPIRINCGGKPLRTADGTRWGGDCFSLGGQRKYVPGVEGDERSGPSAIHQTERDFFLMVSRHPEDPRIPGYSIPLPQGSYKVTLHCIAAPGAKQRSFGITLEGETVLSDFDPAREGFRKPQVRSFTARTSDGALDIGFIAGIRYPQLNAIEIERLDP